MKKITLAGFLLFCSLHCSGQKYAELYAAGKYLKSLAACEKQLDEDKGNTNAAIYKAACLFALHLEEHEDFRSGAAKGIRTLETAGKRSGYEMIRLHGLYETLIKNSLTIAAAYCRDGKNDKAKTLYDFWIGNFNAPQALYEKSRMMQAMDSTDAAMELLNQACRQVFVMHKNGDQIPASMSAAFLDFSDALMRRDYPIEACEILLRGQGIFPSQPALLQHRMTALDTMAATASDTVLGRFVLDEALLGMSDGPDDRAIGWWWRCLLSLSVKEPGSYDRFIGKAFSQLPYSDENSRFLHQGFYTALEAADWTKKNADQRAAGYGPLLTGLLLYRGKHVQTSTSEGFNALIAETLREKPVVAASKLYAIGSAIFAKKEIEKSLSLIVAAALEKNTGTEECIALYELLPRHPKLDEHFRKKLLETLPRQFASNDFSGAGASIRRGLKLFPADKELLELKRKWVILDYDMNFKNVAVSDAQLQWTGNKEQCIPGRISDGALAQSLQLLNYLRRLAGVPDECTWSDSCNYYAQHAAFLMHANGKLSHNPDETWSCYSWQGFNGASHTNLSYGHHTTSALLGELGDDGAGNYATGHRRWILYPYRKVFGIGATKNTTALWVFGKGSETYDELPEDYQRTPVTWPPADFVPAPLLFGRWSFSLDGADFSAAKVTVKENGRSIPVKQEPLSQGYGMNTLVFLPALTQPAAGKTYQVTVSKIISSWPKKTVEYSYSVTVLEMQ